MADGGTREIIVRLVSEMKGGAQKVVGEARKQAKAVEKAKTEEAKKGEAEREKVAEKSTKKRAKAELSSEEKQLQEKQKLKKKFENEEDKRARERNLASNKEARKARQAELKEIRDDFKKQAQEKRAEQRRAKREEKAQVKKEEQERRAQARREAREKKQADQQEAKAAKEKAAKERKEAKEKQAREKKSAQEKEKEEKKLAREKAAKEKKDAQESARISKARYSDYKQQRAELGLDKKGSKKLSEKEISDIYSGAGSDQAKEKIRQDLIQDARQQRGVSASISSKRARYASARSNLAAILDTGPKRGIGDLPAVDQEVLGAAKKSGDLIKQFSKTIWSSVLTTVTAGASGYILNKVRQGTAMNYGFRASQDVLTGLIEPGERAGSMFSIGNRAYARGARLGMSPESLMKATASYAKAMGEQSSQEGGLTLAKVRGTTGMSVSESAGVLASIRGRGVGAKKAENELAKMFGVAFSSGVEESTRQPEFVKSFADLMIRAHAKGATTASAGRVVAGLGARGGALGQSYAISAAAQLDQAVSGGGPMTSQAAFTRMSIGYGRPGSKMNFFQAEAMRRKGILANPQMLMSILDTLRQTTFGNKDAMAYQLVNMYGLEQAQAEKVAGMHSLGSFKAQDIYNEAKAQAKTPRGAQVRKAADIDLMKATSGLTDKFESLNTKVSELARQKLPELMKKIDEIFKTREEEEAEIDPDVEAVLNPTLNKLDRIKRRTELLTGRAQRDISAEELQKTQAEITSLRNDARRIGQQYAREEFASQGKAMVPGTQVVAGIVAERGGDVAAIVKKLMDSNSEQVANIVRILQNNSKMKDVNLTNTSNSGKK